MRDANGREPGPPPFEPDYDLITYIEREQRPRDLKGGPPFEADQDLIVGIEEAQGPKPPKRKKFSRKRRS